MTDPVSTRREVIAAARRIVVKVGSQLLRAGPNEEPDARIFALVAEIAKLRDAGFEVTLVSSGSIGAGMGMLEQKKRPSDLPRLQALAATGQARLMACYERACQAHGFHCAQILLVADDLKHRQRHLNIRNCLHTLQQQNILPVINENDTVSVDEIRFGDNDTLAALVSTMIRADLTVLLTTVDGLHTREGNTLGTRISLVEDIGDDLRAMAAGTDGNALSVGGMITKLNAAELCMSAGEHLWICDGRDFSNLQRLVAAEDLGTLFFAKSAKMGKSKRWLAFFTEPVGRVLIDAGAAVAILEGGKSLLPSGVVAVEGDFAMGDTVSICDLRNTVIGVGICNYGTADLRRLRGLRSGSFEDVLQRPCFTSAIHRNNLAILPPS
jgi:glutamate 5-kinase